MGAFEAIGRGFARNIGRVGAEDVGGAVAKGGEKAASQGAADVGADAGANIGAEVRSAATKADASATSAASREEAKGFVNGGKPIETTEMKARAWYPRAQAAVVATGGGIAIWEFYKGTEQVRQDVDDATHCVTHLSECKPLGDLNLPDLPSLPNLPSLPGDIGKALTSVPGMQTAMNVFGAATGIIVLVGVDLSCRASSRESHCDHTL